MSEPLDVEAARAIIDAATSTAGYLVHTPEYKDAAVLGFVDALDEVERLRATIGRVRALAEEWNPRSQGAVDIIAAVLAALDGVPNE